MDSQEIGGYLLLLLTDARIYYRPSKLKFMK